MHFFLFPHVIRFVYTFLLAVSQEVMDVISTVELKKS